MTLKSPPTPTWNPRIEGLRGVAILLVFFAHINPDKAHNWGTIGVAIFFIISGFVITGSLIKLNNTFESKNRTLFGLLNVFYRRRARRLLPLAILTIFTTLLISFLDSSADHRQYILSSLFCLFYVGNLFGYTFNYTDLAPAIGHFWSLGVEEQFYFFWPIMFYFLIRPHKRPRFMNLIVLGIFVTQVSHPLIVLMNKTPYTLPTTYIDLLLFGCLLQLTKDKAERLSGVPLALTKVFGILSLLVIIFSKSFSSDGVIKYFGYNLYALLAAAVFIFSLNSNFLNNFILRYFGRISYSLYCIHWPCFYFWRTFIGGGVISMLVAGTLSIILSSISHKYFESRFYDSKSHERQ